MPDTENIQRAEANADQGGKVENTQIRWHQRLQNYSRALGRLSAAVNIGKTRSLTDLEKQGLIQAFEFTHELAWNVMKDYFIDQGNTSITGAKDATREAFKQGLIVEGEGWMEMIRSRNLSSHTYNEEIAEEIATKIITVYNQLFESFLNQMNQLKSKP